MPIIQVPSVNFYPGRKSYKPEAIVVHTMQGTLFGTDCWFQSPVSKASAHYGIGKAGQVHQYVSERDTALHTGRIELPTWKLIKRAPNGLIITPDYYTIGIELEGDMDIDWTAEMYDSSSRLISEICLRWNIPVDSHHIIGHHEIYAPGKRPRNSVNLDWLIELVTQTRQLVTYQLQFKSMVTK